MDTITIENIELMCIIGVRDYERIKKQPVIVSITLFVDLSKAGKSDNLKDTVDYSTLYKTIKEHVEISSYYLLEALAQSIADMCLEDKKVRSVKVEIKKPQALHGTQYPLITIERKNHA